MPPGQYPAIYDCQEGESEKYLGVNMSPRLGILKPSPQDVVQEMCGKFTRASRWMPSLG